MLNFLKHRTSSSNNDVEQLKKELENTKKVKNQFHEKVSDLIRENRDLLKKIEQLESDIKKIKTEIVYKNTDEIDAEIWQITITEGIMAAIHADFFDIKELYIPEWNLVINLSGGFNVFKLKDKERYAKEKNKMSFAQKDPVFIKKIKLDKTLTAQLRQLAQSYDFIEKNKILVKDKIKEII